MQWKAMQIDKQKTPTQNTHARKRGSYGRQIDLPLHQYLESQTIRLPPPPPTQTCSCLHADSEQPDRLIRIFVQLLSTPRTAAFKIWSKLKPLLPIHSSKSAYDIFELLTLIYTMAQSSGIIRCRPRTNLVSEKDRRGLCFQNWAS